MRPGLLILPTLLVMVVLASLVLLTRHLRHLGEQRLAAEREGASAFEEMAQLARELQDRGQSGAAEPPGSIGDRLRRRYPGSSQSPRARSAG